MATAPDKAKLDADFSELYKAHLKDVYSYSYYRVGNHHDAEDLTEQTFLQGPAAAPVADPDRAQPRRELLPRPLTPPADQHRRRRSALDPAHHRGAGAGP